MTFFPVTHRVMALVLTLLLFASSVLLLAVAGGRIRETPNYSDHRRRVVREDRDAVVFNVMDFGAVADGKHNDTQAFVDAFTNCSRASIVFWAEVYVPDGRYSITPFSIPHCESCTFRIHGNLLGPKEQPDWQVARALIQVEGGENFHGDW